MGKSWFCFVDDGWVGAGRKNKKLTLFDDDDDNRFAWAATALPERFFPAGLGETVRQLAALCEYPGKRARYHACYYDLKEDVDYNYLAVPMRACEGLLEDGLEALKGMGPIEVQVYGESGVLTENKRTMPIAMRLTASFPPRILVLRQFVDACLSNKEDVCKALVVCSASSSAG